MKHLLTLVLMLTLTVSYGQKLKGSDTYIFPNSSATTIQLQALKTEIPSKMIVDFVTHAKYTYFWSQTSFRPMLIQHFGILGYGMRHVDLFVEDMLNQPNVIYEVLRCIWLHSSKDSDFLYMQFKSFGVSATTANYLVDYCQKHMK